MPETKVSLVTKLTTIMGELGGVEKSGFNKAQQYKFVREADVVAKLVPLLAKYHVYLHTTVTSHTHEPLYITASGAQMWLDTVTMEGTWMDGDTGDTLRAATFVGTGADTGDKGVFKAQTGAEKYLLLKSLLISTGDDPEADEKVDKAAEAAGAASGAPRVVRGSQTGVRRGGRSSVATAAQVAETVRLLKELNLTTAEAAYPLIQASLGHIPMDGQKMSAFLADLKGDEIAKLISDLMEFKPIEVDDESVAEPTADDAENERPPAMAVV